MHAVVGSLQNTGATSTSRARRGERVTMRNCQKKEQIINAAQMVYAHMTKMRAVPRRAFTCIEDILRLHLNNEKLQIIPFGHIFTWTASPVQPFNTGGYSRGPDDGGEGRGRSRGRRGSLGLRGSRTAGASCTYGGRRGASGEGLVKLRFSNIESGLDDNPSLVEPVSMLLVWILWCLQLLE